MKRDEIVSMLWFAAILLLIITAVTGFPKPPETKTKETIPTDVPEVKSKNAGYPVDICTLDSIECASEKESYREDTLKEKVFKMTDEAGMPRKAVSAIITCESNWRTDAISRTNDIGLWQINHYVHIRTGSITEEQALDPIESTNYAILLWQKHGFVPWVCAHNLGIV
jgi:hypothetical protein